MRYIKEAIVHSRRELQAVGSVCVTIWAFVGALLDKRILWLLLAVMFAIFVVVSCGIILARYISVKRGFITVEIFHNHRVTLMRNDFQVNADYLLHHLDEQKLKELVLVMGIDITADMALNTRRGIAYDMLKYLNSNYTEHGKLPQDVITEQISGFFNSKSPSGERCNLDFGECIDVELELTPKNDASGKTIPCNLLMVVNSKKKDYNKKNHESIDSDGKSNLIIPAVYNHIKSTNKYTSLLIGIMGSNGLAVPYLPEFSQIINQLAWTSTEAPDVLLYDVYLSIREQDYFNHWKVSLSQLEAYLHACANYYPPQTEK